MDIKKIINIHANMKVYRKMLRSNPGTGNGDIMDGYRSLIFFGELLDFYEFYKGGTVPGAAGRVLTNGQLPALPSPLDIEKNFNNIRHANKYTYKSGSSSLKKYAEALNDINNFVPNIIQVIEKLDPPLKRVSKIQSIKGRKQNPEFTALSTGIINSTVPGDLQGVIGTIVKGRMLELKPDYAQGPADHFPLTVAGLREYLGKPGSLGFRDIQQSLFYKIFSLEVHKKLTRIVPTDPPINKKFMNKNNDRIQFYYVPGDIRAIVDDCLIRGELAILELYDEKTNFYRAYLARYHAYTHEMKEAKIDGANRPVDIALGLPDTNTYRNVKSYIEACCSRLDYFQLGKESGIEKLKLDDKRYVKYFWDGSIYKECPPDHQPEKGRPWVTMTIHLGETRPTISPSRNGKPARLTGSAGSYQMYDLVTKRITAKGGQQVINTKTAAIQFCQRDLEPIFTAYYINEAEARNSIFKGEYEKMKGSITSMLSKYEQLIRKNSTEPLPGTNVRDMINEEFLKLLTKGGGANES